MATEETKPVEREAFATFGNWCDSQMIECTMANADKYGRAMRDAALERAAQIAENEARSWDANAPDPQHRIAVKVRALKGSR